MSFIIGCFVGAIIGVVTVCLCVVVGESEDEMSEMQGGYRSEGQSGAGE